VTDLSHAVFLSYASQDAEATQKICDALRAGGVEVFFDKSELRGGDVWDQKIRRQINDCSLFVPVISANTASRREGYFRLEWDLADRRSHRMARDQVFIVPISVDETPGTGTDVPESFHRVQWTRLPGGDTPPEFVARIKHLLSSDPTAPGRVSADAGAGVSTIPLTGRPSLLRRALPAGLAVLVIAAIAYLLINKPWIAKAPPTPAASNATSKTLQDAFNPPPHSIAVLPFVNMSGDPGQEYFSDGLSEELLNDLSRINELQVAARTSAFSFKGKDTDISFIARKLNVGAVLEGSVRRSGHTVRVTAQLINAVTGFHLWSQTYDRDLGDELKLQTEIATAVASALKVTLLGDVAAKIEAGGTRNPAAFDLYLRATKTYRNSGDAKTEEAAIADYSEAIRLDPGYALAYAARSIAIQDFTSKWSTTTSAFRSGLDKAREDADTAIALAPGLSDGHLALALLYQSGLEFKLATEEFEHALALAPGNARVLRSYGLFSVYIGRGDAGLTSLRRALVLDPMYDSGYGYLGGALMILRRYPEAIAAYNDGATLASDRPGIYSSGTGLAHYLHGDFESARSSCEMVPEDDANLVCLAIAYDKLGRHADAQGALAKVQAHDGNMGALSYSAIYANWGKKSPALDWLEKAMHLRDPDLLQLNHPLYDPLRNEPRFQAVLRALHFPD
jgi:TolB-like protein